jgi:integrase
MGKPKAPDGRERRLKPGELEALTEACRTAAGSWLLHGFQLAIETGLRRGELLGIRWRDISFDAAVLHVPFTKTDKPRTIPLTDRAVEILADHKAVSSGALHTGAITIQVNVLPEGPHFLIAVFQGLSTLGV